MITRADLTWWLDLTPTLTWTYAKLKDLMVAHPSNDVTSRKSGEGKQPSAFVRRAPGK